MLAYDQNYDVESDFQVNASRSRQLPSRNTRQGVSTHMWPTPLTLRECYFHTHTSLTYAHTRLFALLWVWYETPGEMGHSCDWQ